MEKRLVALLGTTAKHIFGGLRRALRALALTFLITAVVVAAATELIAAFLTQTFPTGLTHLAAAALAIAFGYAAMITVAIEEILRAIIKVVELIVEEAEKVEKKAVQEIELLTRKAEEEALRFGKTAASDAGALGHAVVGDAGVVGRALGGLAGGAVGAVGGAVGAAEREVKAVEHGIGAHIPGHHNAAAMPAAGSNTPTLPSSNQSDN